MRGWKVVALSSAVLTLIALATPRAAQAGNSLTDGLIIGGIVTGVVATVIIVAILVEGSREPEPELMGFAPTDRPRRTTAGMSMGCAQPDGTRAVLCW